jgi:uncharacterized membrane protein
MWEIDEIGDIADLATALGCQYINSGKSKKRSGTSMLKEAISAPNNPRNQEQLHRRSLFSYARYPHQPRNVNLIFEAENAAGNFNQKVAVGMTKMFSAMSTFWLITAWIALRILVNATIIRFDPLPWPLLLCLASVPQLPLMIVIMVGQNLLGRKQELQAAEQYETTMKTYNDIEQIMSHLSSQDEEILQQTYMIMYLMQADGISPEPFLASQANQSHGHKLS